MQLHVQPLICVLMLLWPVPARAEPDDAKASCVQDAMIVFDASGSMGGTDMNSVTPRIGKVRQALAKVLPDVTPVRPVGLIVYGPGAANNCNSIELRVKPTLNSAAAIMDEVNSTVPAGRTPLTASVRQAAEVLDYQAKPATIVLITDGEETCGGDPCGVASALKLKAKDLTIHVIGYKDPLAIKGPFGSRCMADATGGKYVAVDTTDQLTAALRAALGCPFFTQAPAGSNGRSATASFQTHWHNR